MTGRLPLVYNASSGSYQSLPSGDTLLPGLASLAAAKAAVIPSAMFGVIYLQGYYTPGDGGGAAYLHAPSPGAGPGKFQSADGQWWILARAPYKPRQFGARGDGETVDSAAIQQGLSFVGAIGQALAVSGLGPTIPLEADPGDNYVIGDIEIPSYAALTVAGCVPGLPGAVLTQAPGSSIIIGNQADVSGVGVVGFLQLGLGDTSDSVGVNLANATRSVVSSNNFNSFGLQGLFIGGIANRIRENVAGRCLLNRAAVTTFMGAVQIAGTDSYVEDNECTPSLTTDYSSSNLFCCGLLVQGGTHFLYGNIGEFADVGIRIEGDAILATANRADHNFGPGFWISESGEAQMVNNFALDNSLHASGAYSAYLINGVNSLFINNSSSVDGIVKHKYGFEDTSGGDANKNEYGPTNFASFGSAISTYSPTGFAGPAISVANGPLRSVADGTATPSVDNYSQFGISNSDIMDFVDGVNGQEITVFMGPGVRIHNTGVGGIITPTGGTITYTSGQTQKLINAEGNWIFSSNNP